MSPTTKVEPHPIQDRIDQRIADAMLAEAQLATGRPIPPKLKGVGVLSVPNYDCVIDGISDPAKFYVAWAKMCLTAGAGEGNVSIDGVADVMYIADSLMQLLVPNAKDEDYATYMPQIVELVSLEYLRINKRMDGSQLIQNMREAQISSLRDDFRSTLAVELQPHNKEPKYSSRQQL